MITWAIKDINFRSSHSITIVMEETTEDGHKYLYSITKGSSVGRAEILAEFKTKILAARANRAKLEAIKAQINVNQIEAFLAQP